MGGVDEVMVGEQGRVDLGALRIALERAVAAADTATLPAIVGVCAEMQARASARLATPAPAPTPPAHGADLVDAVEMAKRVNMSVFWIRDQAKVARIPVHRVGRRLLFDPAAVVAALKALELQTARKGGGQDQRSWAHRREKRRQNKDFTTTETGARGESVHEVSTAREIEAAR